MSCAAGRAFTSSGRHGRCAVLDASSFALAGTTGTVQQRAGRATGATAQDGRSSRVTRARPDERAVVGRADAQSSPRGASTVAWCDSPSRTSPQRRLPRPGRRPSPRPPNGNTDRQPGRACHPPDDGRGERRRQADRPTLGTSTYELADASRRLEAALATARQSGRSVVCGSTPNRSSQQAALAALVRPTAAPSTRGPCGGRGGRAGTRPPCLAPLRRLGSGRRPAPPPSRKSCHRSGDR